MDDTIANRLLQAKAFEKYTKGMNRKIYGRANENGFRPMRLNKRLKGKSEAEQLKNLSKEIGSKYFPFKGDNLDKPFGFNKTRLDKYEKAMDEFNIRGFSPEQLREVVLADSAALNAIYSRKQYALTGNLTPKKMQKIAGQANVLGGARGETVGMADGAALTDTTENTTLIDLLKNSLNFSTFMTDRQSKLQSFMLLLITLVK